MADGETSTEQPKLRFCSEILSPSELFQARTRSHKLPLRGQKDFLHTGSERQRERLDQSLQEHWTLVAEERVERSGSLVKAGWIPDDGIVELQTPAGKFWQTMGYAAHGKQYLLPEEALYLMECGNLQVFHHKLPLSIEEAYEKLLSSEHPGLVSLQQYQVFGHLKRLGYVVNRFDPSIVQSMYERQLNLPQTRDRYGAHLKRKRSLSPSNRHAASRPTPPSERPEEEERPDPPATPTCPDPPDPLNPPQSPGQVEGRDAQGQVEGRDDAQGQEEGRDDAQGQVEGRDAQGQSPGTGRSWWTKGSEVSETGSPDLQGAEPQSPSPRWDYGRIRFPNLGSSRASRSPPLGPPDPRLLPGALQVGRCDVAPWLQRLNQRAEHLSRRDRDRQRERDRYHRDVNDDRDVRRCRNWAEYLELLERRRSRRNHGDRPAHLWEGAVKPLSQPGHTSSHSDLLHQIGVIQSSRLLDDAISLSIPSQWKISFDVYQPDTVADYKKSNPGKPYTRMCVCSFEGPVPDLQVVKSLSFQSGEVPVTFAVVDHGDISFYSFKDFTLPVDVCR
ncbi:tRNA-splicing endonuclease subunit Sen54 isoform X1 [Alosa sapidissima]|uniref:tRNA-splicing endonuclease subunit Sen54 isoform X1 n=2 Tax=Alosa sapidissima TaxID=34773 RepID=UPI001C08AAF9|nr:tRNA-splicing endonuclease subunit Sen54 isoform X1 [Alosa sapidissima]XP_041939017.1 tRNA-splicing endonuclease subunit Sen54 isoform X1 [Alosa sapidissima]